MSTFWSVSKPTVDQIEFSGFCITDMSICYPKYNDTLFLSFYVPSDHKIIEEIAINANFLYSMGNILYNY